MFQWVVLSALLMATTASAQQQLHVFYYHGQTIEQMSVSGVTITLSFKGTGRVNQVALWVNNGSTDAVNVIPEDFLFHQSLPKDEDLQLKSQQEVQKLAARNVLGHFVTGVRSGITRADDKMSGREPGVTDSTAPTGYEDQARWLAHMDELGERGEMSSVGRFYLRGSTVFPSAKFSGVLWFDRGDPATSAIVRVKLGPRAYEFPFPAPASATTPANPDKQDSVANAADEVSDAKRPAQQTTKDPGGGKAGVMGISGENWMDGGVLGVKITEVAHNSAAELAGLYAGCVITEIEASRIHTTDDLAEVLAKYGPGSRISVTYLIRTHLGWVSKVTAVILTGGD